MIKELKLMLKKYQDMQKKGSEYVSIDQVTNDLYRLQQDARLKRIPKDLR